MNVAGVEANTQAVIMRDFVDNLSNLIEAPPDFSSLACHRLECNADIRLLRSIQYFI
ncbi:hypothetical protein D3C81_2342540 [compost metagenome]